MKIIGLCGRSGSGKGYVCERFASRGVTCIDTDALYRRLTSAARSPRPLVRELAGAFGGCVVAPDNSLDRRALADIVFSDAAALALLNSISHKHILRSVRRRLASLAKRGDALAVVDAPVLFESGFDAECDLTVCVTAPEATRVRRIMRRDGIDEAAARRRLAAQKDDGELIALCGEVIENDGEDEKLERQIDGVIAAALAAPTEKGDKN